MSGPTLQLLKFFQRTRTGISHPTLTDSDPVFLSSLDKTFLSYFLQITISLYFILLSNLKRIRNIYISLYLDYDMYIYQCCLLYLIKNKPHFGLVTHVYN